MTSSPRHFWTIEPIDHWRDWSDRRLPPAKVRGRKPSGPAGVTLIPTRNGNVIEYTWENTQDQPTPTTFLEYSINKTSIECGRIDYITYRGNWLAFKPKIRGKVTSVYWTLKDYLFCYEVMLQILKSVNIITIYRSVKVFQWPYWLIWSSTRYLKPGLNSALHHRLLPKVLRAHIMIKIFYTV